MTAFTTIASPLGDLLLVGEDAAEGLTLTSLSTPGRRSAPAIRDDWTRAPDLFAGVAVQLAEYFAGERTEFAVARTVTGSAFQRRVWALVDDIPFGRTTTYGRLAAELGLPRDRVQALGAAVGANPLLVLRPCHRVVGADGSMRGYAGGVERKMDLLIHEGALAPALL